MTLICRSAARALITAGRMQRVSGEHPKDLCECGHRRANHRASGPLEGSCSVAIHEMVGRKAKQGDGLEAYRASCGCVRFLLSRSHDERKAAE